MKICPKCNSQVNDEAMFCAGCGYSFAPQGNQPQAAAPAVNQYDHTSEFSPEEVKDNKIFALLCYVMSIFGVIIALLATGGKPSDYLRFHIKQVLSVTILEVLAGIISGVLVWTCIVPFAGIAALGVLMVVQYIGFFMTAGNKSVEIPIVRKFGFLK